MHSVFLKAMVTLGVFVSVSAPLNAQSRDSDVPIPSWMLGEFVDDYDIRYVIQEDQWLQGTRSLYHIEEWNVAERYLLARNSVENPGEPGLWTRIDWVVLEPWQDFEWAFCYAVYDAESMAAARAGPASNRGTPREGCNGFPFSRIRRAQ